MYKTASQIAHEVLVKCAKKDEGPQYGKALGRGALSGGVFGGTLGAGFGAIPAIRALLKGGKVTANDLKILGSMTGIGGATGAGMGAGIGLTSQGGDRLMKGEVNPTSVGTAGGGLAGMFAGPALMSSSLRNPMISHLTVPAAMGIGALGGSGLGLGAGKLIEKIRGNSESMNKESAELSRDTQFGLAGAGAGAGLGGLIGGAGGAFGGIKGLMKADEKMHSSGINAARKRIEIADMIKSETIKQDAALQQNLRKAPPASTFYGKRDFDAIRATSQGKINDAVRESEAARKALLGAKKISPAATRSQWLKVPGNIKRMFGRSWKPALGVGLLGALGGAVTGVGASRELDEEPLY